MNKFECILSDNIIDASVCAFKKINTQNFEVKNVVFVPSGEKEWAENLLFETLKTKVLFNVEVVSIGEFLSSQTKKTPISAIWQKSLIKKALLQAKNLCVFDNKNINDGLVCAVLSEIQRFQKAALNPKDLLKITTQNAYLKQKLEDLSKIYAEYLLLLDSNVDSSTIFNVYLDNAKRFLNQNFFFVGFNDFSVLEQRLIVKLLEFGEVTITALCKKSGGNSYVFNKPVWLNKLKESGVICDVIETQKSVLSLNQQKILSLCFSVEDKKEYLDFLNVFECEDLKEEVFNVARIIKKLAFDGKISSLKDVKIICGNLQAYMPIIEKTFKDFNFDVYFESAKKADTLNLSQFVKNVLRFLNDCQWESLINVALSRFSGLSKQEKTNLVKFYEENKLTNFDIASLTEELKQSLSLFIDKINSLRDKSPLVLIENILETFEAEKVLLSVCQALENNGFNEESLAVSYSSKILMQIQESLQEFADENITLNEFISLFEESLTSATLPQKDSSGIFVAGYNGLPSFCKFLFVIGANQGVMPSSKNDTDILTDEEISLTSSFSALETTLTKNRLARLNVLQSLVGFTEGLFVSYALADSQGQKLLPSVWVQGLSKCASSNVLTVLSKGFPQEFDSLSLKEKISYFAHTTGCYNNAETEFLKGIKSKSPDFASIKPTLQKLFKNFTIVEEDESIENPQELFFPSNNTKISQIESYYSCPFKHFMQYGLKLFENKTTVLQANDAGNVLHKVAEEFLAERNGYIENNVNSLDAVNQIFDNIKNHPKFQKLFSSQNKVARQILTEESVRLCNHLKTTYPKSAFKPKFLEVKFGTNQKFNLTVLNQDFSVIGVVDRVDVWNNNAVVIDYKSSDNIKGNLPELFYGEKLQIFVYAKALENLFNLKLQGVFYLPIVNKFFHEKQIPYMLRGKCVDSPNFYEMMDKTICLESPKSTIFPCEISTSQKALKSGNIEYKSNQSHIKEDNFNDMMDYAVEMARMAIKEILLGNLKPNPTEKACTYCPYVSICPKPSSVLPREHAYNIKDHHFALWKTENNNKEESDEQN